MLSAICVTKNICPGSREADPRTIQIIHMSWSRRPSNPRSRRGPAPGLPSTVARDVAIMPVRNARMYADAMQRLTQTRAPMIFSPPSETIWPCIYLSLSLSLSLSPLFPYTELGAKSLSWRARASSTLQTPNRRAALTGGETSASRC